MRILPVRLVLAALGVALLLVACASGSGGGSGAASTPEAVATLAGSTPAAASAAGGGGGGATNTDPCNLATPEMVASAFGGTSSPGVPGNARNCTFTVTGGSVPTVDVYYYGTAGEFDGIRAGFESNREGTTDVAGIGSQAFHPNDAGPTELVIAAGDAVYSVSAGFKASDDVNADVAELATAIAASLGG